MKACRLLQSLYVALRGRVMLPYYPIYAFLCLVVLATPLFAATKETQNITKEIVLIMSKDIDYSPINEKRWQLAEYLITKHDFPIIPLYPFDYQDGNKAGKVPRVKGWPERTSTSLEELDRWYEQDDYNNIGMPLGGKVGIVAIDVDGEEGMALLKEMSGGAKIPRTVKYITGGGGVRYLFKVKEEDRGKKFRKYTKSGSNAHNECSLLGDGCQTVLPYSIHPNGKTYDFIKDRSFKKTKLAYAPDWVRDLMLRETKAPEAKATKIPAQTWAATAKRNMEGVVGTYDLPGIFAKCPRLQDICREQKKRGVDYDTWHNTTRLLCQLDGFQDFAMEFSEMSSKHDERSVQSINGLLDEYSGNSGNVPTIRCATFGCTESDIKHCHAKINKNADGEITNSPAIKIQTFNAYDANYLASIGIRYNDRGKLDVNPGKFLRLFRKENKIYVIDSLSVERSVFYHYLSKSGYWNRLSEKGLYVMFQKTLDRYAPDDWTPDILYKLKKSLAVLSKVTTRLEKPTDYICVKNGLFNLKTFSLEEHRPNVFSTTKIPLKYDPKAEAPIFMKSLEEIFEGDQERINLIQEMMGDCLTSNALSETVFFLKGDGGNGKSVVLNALKMILGTANYSTVPLDRFNDRFSAAEMIDKLANIADESESTIEMKTAQLKRIASGNDTQGERKFQDAYSYKPFCTLLFSFNDLPKTKDHSRGLKRRLLIIPFDRDFEGMNKDPFLSEKLEAETAGIFAWAIEGLKRLQSKRKQNYKGAEITIVPYQFSKCEAAEIEHDRYFRLVDFHEDFLNTCLKVIIDPGNPNSWKKVREYRDDVYRAFRYWALERDNREAKQESMEEALDKIRKLLKAKGVYYNRPAKKCSNTGRGYFPNVEFTVRGADLLKKGNVAY